MITKEQIIADIEWRLENAQALKTQFENKWREDITNDDVYVQFMMWYASCVTLENLLNSIKGEIICNDKKTTY